MEHNSHTYISTRSVLHRQRGAALITMLVIFTALSVAMLLGIAIPILNDAKNVQRVLASQASFYTAEAGVEDLALRLRDDLLFDNTELLTLNNATATTTTTTVIDPQPGYEVLSEGDKDTHIQRVQLNFVEGDGTAFNYGIQAGNGGFRLENSSFVTGNVFSNGTIIGENNNLIGGSAISAGPMGLIDGVNIETDAYGHTIQNADVGRDAYYADDNLINTTVTGTAYGNQTPIDPIELPISDEQIEEWKSAAEAGGVISEPCPYTITSDESIGPVKIECDLSISGNNFIVSVGGPIWVEGNIETRNGPTIAVDPSLSGKSVMIIADNPINHATGSTIVLENDTDFDGAGEGSYVLMVSENADSSLGGSTVAITLGQSVGGDLLVYSREGEIRLQNFARLKEVTAYTIRLQNNTEVIYETGLASVVFDTGPSGGFEIAEWKEVE